MISNTDDKAIDSEYKKLSDKKNLLITEESKIPSLDVKQIPKDIPAKSITELKNNLNLLFKWNILNIVQIPGEPPTFADRKKMVNKVQEHFKQLCSLINMVLSIREVYNLKKGTFSMKGPVAFTRGLDNSTIKKEEKEENSQLIRGIEGSLFTFQRDETPGAIYNKLIDEALKASQQAAMTYMGKHRLKAKVTTSDLTESIKPLLDKHKKIEDTVIVPKVAKTKEKAKATAAPVHATSATTFFAAVDIKAAAPTEITENMNFAQLVAYLKESPLTKLKVINNDGDKRRMVYNILCKEEDDDQEKIKDKIQDAFSDQNIVGEFDLLLLTESNLDKENRF